VPVCSNCGGSDFVWADTLRTGAIGRGGLSLRSGGELALGTRVCRGCGHADLFVKDPTILRQPHTWKPGEFVPITPRPSTSAARVAPPTPEPTAAPAPAPQPIGATGMMSAPASPPAPPAAPAAPAQPEMPREDDSAPPAPETGPGARSAEPARKRTSRRKGSKAKPENPSVIHE